MGRAGSGTRRGRRARAARNAAEAACGGQGCCAEHAAIRGGWDDGGEIALRGIVRELLIELDLLGGAQVLERRS
jgi:hypothetical protein